MKKLNYKKISIFLTSLIILVSMSLFFNFVFANPDGGSTPTIKNPLGPGNTSVNALLTKIMSLVTTVGTVIVVFFIIFSGYKFVTAGSSDSDRTKAKDIFFATIIGGAILLGANIIAAVVVKTVENTVK